MTDDDPHGGAEGSALDPPGPPTQAQVFLHQVARAEEDPESDPDFSNVDFYDETGDGYLNADNISANTLASVRWSADYGMPSGDGWWSLVEFPDASAVTLRGGDDSSDPEIFDLPSDEEGRARAVANWCDIYAPLAALHLEPLDPDNTLTNEAREKWESAISSAASWVRVFSSGRLGDLIRIALARDPIYARIKAAMADPTSEEGRLCLQAIDFLRVGPNELCTGQWKEIDA